MNSDVLSSDDQQQQDSLWKEAGWWISPTNLIFIWKCTNIQSQGNTELVFDIFDTILDLIPL